MIAKKRNYQGMYGLEDWCRHGVVMIFSLCLALGLVFANAPVVIGADCPDGDNDDYVVCNGCDVPDGKSCGDCDDGDAEVYPGATEICNGIDDDCDGDVDLADADFNNPDPVNGVDDDSDGIFDEGFGGCIYETDGPADECVTGGRLICEWPPGSPSAVTQWGTLTCEQGVDDIRVWSPESKDDGDSCTNGEDDDCDGDMDFADADCWQPEICDGLDNDNDGEIDEDFPLSDPGNVGQSCTAGIGRCERTGVVYCLPDGTDAVCSAAPGTPKKESISIGKTCENGKDDDCDGLTDLADSDCLGFGQAELCGNGLDDDGDGLVDEGFPTLGLQCSEGIGDCESSGTIVCTADGTGTVCDAVPLSPGEESEDAGTCGDFIDNDCDDFTDADDADCASAYADLGVTCSLPYMNGRPGKDCTGKHTIIFSGGQATEVQADLLALDEDGSLLDIIEDVQVGDAAHLASRTEPDDIKISSKTNKQGTRHTVFAPMPILRVTGTNNGVEDVAYCSIMPYLEVTEPKGLTISLSEGNELDVGAFLPLVDVDTLSILLNGVDILEELGIDPATDFPTDGLSLCGSPGDCVFQIEAGCDDGSMVDVEILNLKVEGLDTERAPDAKAGVEAPDQVNTLSFTVTGLPPGGHIFYIQGDPLRLPKTLSSVCLVDDLTDTGTASAFGITITSPADQQVVLAAPVYVEGTACGGNEIASLKINGKALDVTIPDSQTCTEGDGMFQADECVVHFNEPMEERDVGEAIAGTAAVGTYLRGSNRIIADGIDIEGNRTFNTDTIFALGPVVKPNVALAMNSFAGRSGKFMAEEIDNAFVFNLEEEGAQKFLEETCVGAIALWGPELEAKLSNAVFGYLPFEPVCSCDLNVPLKLDSISFEPQADPCVIDMMENQMTIRLHMPKTTLNLKAKDRCDDGASCVFYCSNMDVRAKVIIQDIWFEYTLTEDAMETNVPGCDDYTVTFAVKDSGGDDLVGTLGTCSNGGAGCSSDGQCDGPGTCADGVTSCNTDGDCALGARGNKCVGGDKDCRNCETNADCPDGTCNAQCIGTCNDYEKNEDFDPLESKSFYVGGVAAVCYAIEVVVRFAIGLVAEVISWFVNLFGGDWDFGLFQFTLAFGDFQFEEDFLDEVSLTEPDSFLCLKDIKLNEDKTEETGVVTVESGDVDIEIEDGGLTGAFGASFATLSPDPEIDETPGPSQTPASAPSSAQVSVVGSDISFLVADDVFNQVFASMKDAGKLQNICTEEDSLTIDDLLPDESEGGCESQSTPKKQGQCYALRDADCSTLSGGTALQACRKRGFCFGYKGADCTNLPLCERTKCESVEELTYTADSSLLLCARVDSDPEMAIEQDDTGEETVITDLLLKQMSVLFVLDRASDGYTGNLDDLNGCNSQEGEGAPDCSMFTACLDLDLEAEMRIGSGSCSGGENNGSPCQANTDCPPSGTCIENCGENETGFMFMVNDVGIQSPSLGAMCSGDSDSNVCFGGDNGGSPCTDDTDCPGGTCVDNEFQLLESALNSIVTKGIEENSEKFAPPNCVPGMDLCGILNFDSEDAQLFGLTTDGSSGSDENGTPYADYLGITVPLGSLFP